MQPVSRRLPAGRYFTLSLPSLSLSFSGEATFDKGKFIDGLNGASKLVRGFATIVDKGAGAMVSLKDRLGPRS